ncbi:MAG: DUF4058 family protein [Oscillatoriophycideae cyanobacterium NC_groundwater_1537_Pr4_S-0.65um_50_18]|nr:DUF4058 family protein [Oscillatoriophycideae cyanobacterium NC_groundwater_1537_Pr4_S-0.65um_50_18]
MRSPFPGMDPYLEHPSLWPDVHNGLIEAIRDDLAPKLAPRYYVGVERRAYLFTTSDLALIGIPDIGIGRAQRDRSHPKLASLPLAEIDVLEVDLPMDDELGENYLEVHGTDNGELITVIELLSPVNKLQPKGRIAYESKRLKILNSLTNLIEIDLMRAGEPMPIVDEIKQSDYHLVVSRAWHRPRAQLYAFNLRHPIPSIPIPLQQNEQEPPLDLNTVLHNLYDRARFDLRLNYKQPPAPPLTVENEQWAKDLIAKHHID